MADQTQRLEIATVKAEIGSDIISRFSNDAVVADPIPTETGDIQNLKQVIVTIENKASVSSTIYKDITSGLAATVEGGIFLVGSGLADEIYEVWKKVDGLAVDTEKRALSSKVVMEYAASSAESAHISEDAAALASAASAAIQLSTGIYPNTAAGLAGTAAGGYFSTPSTDPSKYLFLYKNEAGVAVLVDRYPNAAALESAMKNLREDHSSDVLFSVADEGGFSKFTLTADGGFGTAEGHFGPEKIANGSFEMGAPGSGVDFAINDAAGFARLALGEDGSLKTPAVQLGPNKVAIDGFEMRTSAPDVRFAVVDPSGFHAVHVGAHESLSGAPTPSAPSTVGGLAAIPTSGRQVIAHRGSTVGGIAPENSLDAYKLAARAGYKRVETDVIRTADGQFLIMHDDSINRTCRNAADYSVITGTVNALDKTMAELRANYVLTSAVPRFRRKIPTLDEFLGVCRDFGLYPVIELKYSGFTNAEIEAITNRAIEILGADGFAFCSFKLEYLDYVRSVSPKVELYYIYGTVNTAAIEHMVAMQPAVLYASYTAYTAATVAEAHRRGVKVAAWTVPNNQFDNLLKLGFDEFATDTLAPALAGQSIIYSDYSGAEFAAYTTTGSLVDGVLTLAQGQVLTFVPGHAVSVGFGAFYLNLDLRGTASIAANRLADSVTNAGDEFASYRWQAALYNESFALTVTAGAGGCVIKDVQLAVAKF